MIHGTCVGLGVRPNGVEPLFADTPTFFGSVAIFQPSPSREVTIVPAGPVWASAGALQWAAATKAAITIGSLSSSLTSLLYTLPSPKGAIV